MPTHHKTQIGDRLLKEASKRNREEHYQFFDQVRELIEQAGLSVWSNHQYNRSNFMDLFHQYYPKHFPTEQEFVNHLIDNKIEQFTGKDWIDFHLKKLPNFFTGYHRQYLYSSNLAITIPFKVPAKMNYFIVLKAGMESPKLFGNPTHNAGVSQFVDENLQPFLTEDNYPIYSFSPEYIPSCFKISKKPILDK